MTSWIPVTQALWAGALHGMRPRSPTNHDFGKNTLDRPTQAATLHVTGFKPRPSRSKEHIYCDIFHQHVSQMTASTALTEQTHPRPPPHASVDAPDGPLHQGLLLETKIGYRDGP